MTAQYSIDGTPITIVRYDEVELVESAELGAVGQSSLTIDDVAGTLNVIGLKDFEALETDCGEPYTLLGFVDSRTYERGRAEASNSREIKVTVNDLNDLLAQRIITQKEAKRPRETVHQRVQWLLDETNALGGLVEQGRYQRSTEMMDKADHRNTYPGDVLAECALAAGGFNYYVYPDPDDGTPKLAFRDDNASGSNASPIRISNIATSIGSNVFAPMDEATLVRSPDNIVSRAIVAHARGSVVETREATATAFARRDAVAPNSNVRTGERASKQARHFLRQHKTEEDVIECEIEVPAGAVNLVRAGDRIQAQFGHWGPEGYAGWTYFRVMETRKRPMLRDKEPAAYRMNLRLSPQEDGAAGGGTCAYEPTPEGIYYPLPLATPDDPGYFWGVSDGVTYYVRPGIFYPVVPEPGHYGTVHFGVYGAGGEGSTAFAGDCVQNQFQWILVGAGTLTIQTEIYGGSPRPLAVSWGESPEAHTNFVGYFTSGDAIEVNVTGECVNIVRMGDGAGSTCGGKWGFSQVEWIPD